MAEKQNAPRRVAGEHQAPPRRNDVIRCDYCGEDYAITYKRCPFCDERPDRSGPSSRRASNTRGGGYGRPVNPLQIVGLVISMILIIAALFIVFTKLAPLFNRTDAPASSSSSQSSASSSQEPTPAPSDTPDVSEPEDPAILAQAISLSREDFTLVPNETYQIIAAVSPANTTEAIVWTTSDFHIASVDQDGNVTNLNMGSTQESVIITASCGSVSAECIVRCKPGGTAPPPSTSGTGQPAAVTSGDTGVVVNASSGLNVRSGPGSNHGKIASILNGAKVTILEDSGNGWYKVDYGNNKTGYVSSDYIKVN